MNYDEQKRIERDRNRATAIAAVTAVLEDRGYTVDGLDRVDGISTNFACQAQTTRYSSTSKLKVTLGGGWWRGAPRKKVVRQRKDGSFNIRLIADKLEDYVKYMKARDARRTAENAEYDKACDDAKHVKDLDDQLAWPNKVTTDKGLGIELHHLTVEQARAILTTALEVGVKREVDEDEEEAQTTAWDRIGATA